MTDDQLDKSALKRLLDVIGGDPEDFDEMREEYFESVPDILTELQSAADASDLDQLRVAAHSLKSNARDFGAAALAELCGTLEAECKTGVVVDPSGSVAKIVTAEAAAAAALKALDVNDLG